LKSIFNKMYFKGRLDWISVEVDLIVFSQIWVGINSIEYAKISSEIEFGQILIRVNLVKFDWISVGSTWPNFDRGRLDSIWSNFIDGWLRWILAKADLAEFQSRLTRLKLYVDQPSRPSAWTSPSRPSIWTGSSRPLAQPK